MPRVTTVKQARKDQGSCGGCGKAINAGDSYRWWKFRRGGKRKRCMDCRIKSSDLTQSAHKAALYDAVEAAEGSLDRTDPQASVAAGEALAEAIREVVEEMQEAVSNIQEYFPSGNPTSEELEERAYELEAWADEVESLAQEVEAAADDRPESDDYDSEDPELEDEDEQEYQDALEVWEGELDGHLDSLEAVFGNCPE